MNRNRQHPERPVALQRARGEMCAVAATVVLLIGWLTACGGGTGSMVVVHVGRRSISKAAVDHWMRVIARNGSFGAHGGPTGTTKQRALALLISSNWLIGEAERQGIPTSRIADEETVGSQGESAEPQMSLRETGQTVADVKLEVRAEVALEAIRERLTERAVQTPPREREVLDFYRRHRSLFHAPAERVTDLVEEQPSASVAAALGHRLGAGRRFAAAAFRERIGLTAQFLHTPEKVRAISTIFATRPGVVGGPVLINGGWVVFVVRAVIPSRAQSLAEAHADVVERLNDLRRRETLARFDREYRARWSARTSCSPGYVVPGCSQSGRRLGKFEDPFTAGAHKVARPPS